MKGPPPAVPTDTAATAKALSAAAWPFSWPSVAVGTFGGEVLFVDAQGDQDGMFRVLILPDPEDEREWRLRARVDLAASDAEGDAVLRLLEIAPLDELSSPA